MSKTILILAANPKNTSRLRLDEEVREIDIGLKMAQMRDEFTLKQVWAVRRSDFRRAMLDISPNIVHFCGHGSGEEGIAFEDDNGRTKLISTEALAGFFELFADKVECVVLNACYSEVQAKEIAKHISHVIGMSKGIEDTAAIEFAVAFYDALGAGKNIDFAYKLACNAVQLTGMPENLMPVLISEKHTALQQNKTEEYTKTDNMNQASDTPAYNQYMEDGVSYDKQGRSIISVASTVFFDNRLRNAFPGVRGLQWFEDPKEALDRLEILLKKPLGFDEGNGYEVMTDPVWWFRGHRALNISKFSRVSEIKCFLDYDEMLLKKLAVFHSAFYRQSFVYLEVYGEKPIGIYQHSKKNMEYMLENWGYAYEEYAMYAGTAVSRQCYDDGAAVINGKVTDISGAELRIRYLSDYNVVIASKLSPINSTEFDRNSGPLFDGILNGTHSFDSLLNFITKLPRL
jgi:hypothetical protein